jgi:hypothetical protein
MGVQGGVDLPGDQVWQHEALMDRNNPMYCSMFFLQATLCLPSVAQVAVPLSLNVSLRLPQADDDSRSQCFTSAPLTADLAVLGPGSLALTVSSDRPCAFVCVRLCEIDPEVCVCVCVYIYIYIYIYVYI